MCLTVANRGFFHGKGRKEDRTMQLNVRAIWCLGFGNYWTKAFIHVFVFHSFRYSSTWNCWITFEPMFDIYHKQWQSLLKVFTKTSFICYIFPPRLLPISSFEIPVFCIVIIGFYTPLFYIVWLSFLKSKSPSQSERNFN